MSKFTNTLNDSMLSEGTYTGGDSIVKNVNAIIAEISRTKRVLDRDDMRFFNFRRFLLTLGFPSDWSLQRLRNSYFHTDNVDFYRMVIGDMPVTLKQIKIRAKSFLIDVKAWEEWYKDTKAI